MPFGSAGPGLHFFAFAASLAFLRMETKETGNLEKNGCVEFPSLGYTPYFRMKPNERNLSTEWLLLSTSSSRLSTTSYSYDILMIVTGAQNPDTPIPLCSHQNSWQTEYPFPPCILGFD